MEFKNVFLNTVSEKNGFNNTLFKYSFTNRVIQFKNKMFTFLDKRVYKLH